MNRLSRSILPQFGATAILLGLGSTAAAQDRPASGDTLLIERVQEKPANLPARGMSMTQVEARFGAPSERMEPRGGQKHDWPTINRWVYPAFTVYFERTRVVDVVMTQASPDEIGPKPPTS